MVNISVDMDIEITTFNLLLVCLYHYIGIHLLLLYNYGHYSKDSL